MSARIDADAQHLVDTWDGRTSCPRPGTSHVGALEKGVVESEVRDGGVACDDLEIELIAAMPGDVLHTPPSPAVPTPHDEVSASGRQHEARARRIDDESHGPIPPLASIDELPTAAATPANEDPLLGECEDPCRASWMDDEARDSGGGLRHGPPGSSPILSLCHARPTRRLGTYPGRREAHGESRNGAANSKGCPWHATNIATPRWGSP